MFSPISASLLILLIVSIAVQRHFNLTQSHLSIFAFVAYIVSVITKKSLTRPTSRNFFFAVFSSKSYGFRFTIKYLIHFELIFVFGVR